MVFFLFRGDGQTPGVRPLCFPRRLKPLPPSHPGHQKDRDQSDPCAACDGFLLFRNLFLCFGRLFLLVGNPLSIRDSSFAFLAFPSLALGLGLNAGLKVSTFGGSCAALP
jgi:hypothetical protein